MLAPNSASPKLHLSLSLDTNALTAAQISGATEVLLINKLLNQCLGSLSLSFSTPASDLNAQDNSNRPQRTAKRRFQSTAVSESECEVGYRPRDLVNFQTVQEIGNGACEPRRRKVETIINNEYSPLSVKSCNSSDDVGNGDNESSEPEVLVLKSNTLSSQKEQDKDPSQSNTSAANVNPTNSHQSIEPFNTLDQILDSQASRDSLLDENDKSNDINPNRVCSDTVVVKQEPLPPLSTSDNSTYKVSPSSSQFKVQSSSSSHKPLYFGGDVPNFLPSLDLSNLNPPTQISANMPLMNNPNCGAYNQNIANGMSNTDSIFISSSSNNMFQPSNSISYSSNEISITNQMSSQIDQSQGAAQAEYGMSENYELFSTPDECASSSKTYNCNLCSYQAARPELVRSHLRNYHSNLRPFRCVLCSHSCKIRCNLVSHYRGLHRLTLEDARIMAKTTRATNGAPQFVPRQMVRTTATHPPYMNNMEPLGVSNAPVAATNNLITTTPTGNSNARNSNDLSTTTPPTSHGTNPNPEATDFKVT